MDDLALAGGLALPWLLGFLLLHALAWPRRPAVTALRLGYGFFSGELLLTLWMRLLSLAGVAFGRISIGVPLLVSSVALLAWLARHNGLALAPARQALAGLLRPSFPRWQRWLWTLLLIWLGLRFASLAAEVAWRPLYPWDAWLQWASKARVWYEWGRIVPFVPADAWLAGAGGAYFDAAPNDPATAPLLQVWSCIALGRWDDSAMNGPWLLMLLALTLAVYGALRDAGLSSLGALIGAYLVASLPLLDTHVALAGSADLMLTSVYTLSALAFYRWVRGRDWRDAALALLFALACPLIEIPGLAWALTLVPGVIAALLPRHGLRLVGVGFGGAALALLALAQFDLHVLDFRLHLDYRPPWQSLLDAYFLFDNWHLLWYGLIALALFGARRLIAAPLAPLTMVGTAALAFLGVVFAFTNAAAWVGNFNRATLQVAPLLLCLGVLLWREWVPATDAAPAATPAPVALSAADA